MATGNRRRGPNHAGCLPGLKLEIDFNLPEPYTRTDADRQKNTEELPCVENGGLGESSDNRSILRKDKKVHPTFRPSGLSRAHSQRWSRRIASLAKISDVPRDFYRYKVDITIATSVQIQAQ